MAEELTVDLATLLDAAQVVGPLADLIADLPVTAALQRVADAVPGGRLAAGALVEAVAWRREAASLSQALTTHAAGLDVAAATYRDVDEALGVTARAAG